jgi:thymidylate synthase (FAD)
MTVVVDYNDMDVAIIRSTDTPSAIVATALAITMKSDASAPIYPIGKARCKDIVLAEHTSVFEHVNYTFLIEGVSRSFLAQITRQRMASPTSGSQHYQIYSDYPMAIDTDHKSLLENSLMDSLHDYDEAVKVGVPREEARQVLPNACTVNYLWTINARSLFLFLQQRLCNRNVKEMRVFAHKVLSLVTDDFPELFSHAGPQCYLGKCQQDRLGMQCSEGIWTPVE